ncbi:MAG TPA: sugar phosphate isomerase/epimerase family protein [Puia sp.]|nr:sugar phosphate isomerase/epimerase family protein [Puia sp.]
MKSSSRREFLQSSAILLTSAVIPSSFNAVKYKPLLSFSTLGCPDWEFSRIIDFAAAHYYDAIEIRGIKRELDLPKCHEFSNAENIKTTLRMMEDQNLKFSDLGSSATLHFPKGAEREKNLDDGKRFIDLAVQLNCPYVRVFPNNFPKDQEKNATIDLIVQGLLFLADYAKGSNVTVLVESHGDLVHIEDIEKVMQFAENKHTGMIWDVVNMWTITKEPPAEAYRRLKKYIRHTHIKDAKINDGKINYVFLGEGETPVFGAIDYLSGDGYKGYFSFEWEKMWHPEIASPELALADFSKKMMEHFNKQ